MNAFTNRELLYIMTALHIVSDRGNFEGAEIGPEDLEALRRRIREELVARELDR